MRIDVANILTSMGFGVDVDFIASADSPISASLVWLSGTAQPSDAAINAAAPSAVAANLSIDHARKVGAIFPVRLSANRTNNTTSFADVTDLQWALAPNRHYAFNFVGAYSAVVATTGLQLAVNGPASPALVRVVGNIATGAAAAFYGVASAYDTALAATASGGATPMPFWVEGNISTGAAGGVFSLRFRSEIAASAVTIFSGSYGLLYVVG